ncbi:DNA polymerase lambda (POLL) [Tasmannia lanceolata]|uniref:DNA polymerase lambda (POLL) n=1 Tax=Tasmannia lanceolata TaxID=3420 RepID=UPI00406343ED
MAPKTRKKDVVQEGMFSGMIVFLVENGVQTRRLHIWKQKLMQMGAIIEDRLSKRVTHIFAMNSSALLQQVGRGRLTRFNGNVLLYQWLEDSLKLGEKVSEDSYYLEVQLERVSESGQTLEKICSEPAKDHNLGDDESSPCKKARTCEDSKVASATNRESNRKTGDYLTAPELQLTDMNARDEDPNSARDSCEPVGTRHISDAANSSINDPDSKHEESSLLYKPPDLNRNITEIFGKLINIYRALGDDRRSFSYYKSIPVIEKLSFKIESVDQVKHLPTIGKSMQDHIHEIVTTEKLSKLEHFEADEKVRTVTLFGEVWGIGPATALKLYEKGHRTLDDLKTEDSLTSAQRLGLKFFDDIKKRIPRHEVKDMEVLLQKAAQDVLPGVVVVCGGSYRRGKATCGDLDIIMTHPDGKSHKGFLLRYVQYLKDIKFLREDLVFSNHSMEGTDSGVDTYFGLCTYPGREQRHRIDLKVYPRDIYAFGLIHWTGNDVLNRRLRLLADSKGYRLDDTGLFLATQSSSGKRGARSSTSLSCKTEREVFDVLGFPWLEPPERNL